MTIPVKLQELLLGQIEDQFWSLYESMRVWIVANPTATYSQAMSQLNSLANPYPTHYVTLSDRQKSFDWWSAKIHPYEGKANAYLSLRQFMLDHSTAFAKQIDPDSGRSVVSKADAWIKRVTGDTVNWNIGGISGHSYACTRDPAKGGAVVSESWTATIDGVQRTLSRTISVSLVGGAYVATPGAWVVG